MNKTKHVLFGFYRSSEVLLNGAKFGNVALLSSRSVCWVKKSFNSWTFSNSST